jgi:hypothetical protein
MVDLYADMSAAIAERTAIDAEMTRLKAARHEAEQRIRVIAAEMLKDTEHLPVAEQASLFQRPSTNGATETTANGTAATTADTDAVTEEDDDEVAGSDEIGRLPPRMLELLRLLRSMPEADYGVFAKKMYGSDTRTTRLSVTSYFSRLKSDRYIESIGPAKFKLTEKGAEICRM